MNQVESGTTSRFKFLSASFATLLRSHSASLSFRRSSSFQKPDITKQSFFAGYADMTTEQERPSRKENRLYNFLTRSRSRSRSAAESAVPSPKPRHPPDNTGSKPPSRLQSRPLSSTTTSTATITPGTPKPSRKSQRPSNTSSPLTPRPTRRPTTPVNRPSSARQKLQDFFTGRKSSTSRSRSRSRPSSPQLNENPPPLPSTSADDDPTPRPKKSPSSRHTTPSPTPTPKVLRVTNATTTSSSTGSTAASIKISKFFSKEPSPPAKMTNPNTPALPPLPISRVSSLYRRSTHNKETLAITTPASPSPSLPSPSQPPKIMHTPPTPLKSPRDSSSNLNASGSTSQLPVPSRPIYHVAKGSLDSSYRYRGNAAMGVVNEETPLVNNYNHKGKAREDPPSSSTNLHLLHTRPSLKMSSSARATKHGSFDFERPGWGSVAVAPSPPTGDGPIKMKRSGSNGTTGTAASDRTSELREKERESTYGPGLAGVGTLQREMSMKRAQEREELIMMRRKREEEKVASSTAKRRNGKEKEEKERPPTSSQRTTPSASDHMHASTSTTGTKHSSSAGKAAGKRMLHSALGGNDKDREKHSTKPSGISRLMAPAHHGLFSFEPPVPSPTRSTGTASTGTAHEVTLTSGYGIKAERERERIRDEKERSSRIPGATRRSGDRAPVPVPSVAALYGISTDVAASPNSISSSNGITKTPRSNIPGPGHRSGKKGRSLDLGLGLAWAPSKVREEALMNLPKSAFFGRRTSSGGSSIPGYRNGNGHAHDMLRTASESTTRSNVTGNGSGRSAAVEDVERSKLGKEVAQVFKNALDADGYKLFKLYVHQFDRHEIPFDGPEGIVSLVEGLLLAAPRLDEDGRKRLLDKFIRIILQQA